MDNLENVCTKYKSCPIFSGEAFKRSNSADIYKKLFCNAGKKKYEQCKRFIVSEKIGKPAPNYIMPNSSKSIEEIIEITNKGN